MCKKSFKTNSKYCSKSCKDFDQILTSQKILKDIISFYDANKRIPLKTEFRHTKTARLRFGSWNKAIIAAGFKPNVERFSKKHFAKDGHKCDSFAEKIIDDWLYARNIQHERSIPYGFRNMTADFKINDIWIEFLGLKGQVKRYDELVKEKEKLWKRRNLKVIPIYPKDLFPENNLNKIFSDIFPSQSFT